MNVKKGKSVFRPRNLVFALMVIAALGGDLILFNSGEQVDPNLEYPQDVFKEEPIGFLMEEHLVPEGMRPVYMFLPL